MPVEIRDGVLLYDDSPATPERALTGAIEDAYSALISLDEDVQAGVHHPSRVANLDAAVESLKTSLREWGTIGHPPLNLLETP